MEGFFDFIPLGMHCPLCKTESTHAMPGAHLFYDCPHCRGIFRPYDHLPDPDFEKGRYRLHDNNPADEGYRRFVMPLCNAVTKNYGSAALGLDFGSGTNSAVSAILRERGFEIAEYDPFFAPEKSALGKHYDFIACCEVMEHFHDPAKEFCGLFKLLRSSGKLFCMTHIWEDSGEFASWYYKNDPTHVFIYRAATVHYIAETFGFADCGISGRLITLSK